MAYSKSLQRTYFNNLLIPRFWASSKDYNAHQRKEYETLFAQQPLDAPAPLPPVTIIKQLPMVEEITGTEKLEDPKAEKSGRKGARQYGSAVRGQNQRVLAIKTGTGGTDRGPRASALNIPG